MRKFHPPVAKSTRVNISTNQHQRGINSMCQFNRQLQYSGSSRSNQLPVDHNRKCNSKRYRNNSHGNVQCRLDRWNIMCGSPNNMLHLTNKVYQHQQYSSGIGSYQWYIYGMSQQRNYVQRTGQCRSSQLYMDLTSRSNRQFDNQQY